MCSRVFICYIFFVVAVLTVTCLRVKDRSSLASNRQQLQLQKFQLPDAAGIMRHDCEVRDLRQIADLLIPPLQSECDRTVSLCRMSFCKKDYRWEYLFSTMAYLELCKADPNFLDAPFTLAMAIYSNDLSYNHVCRYFFTFKGSRS